MEYTSHASSVFLCFKSVKSAWSLGLLQIMDREEGVEAEEEEGSVRLALWARIEIGVVLLMMLVVLGLKGVVVAEGRRWKGSGCVTGNGFEDVIYKCDEAFLLGFITISNIFRLGR